tara:strand:+ start:399 stop:1643 length:1245 start_codon:yes stop_codon:yes gene_type:complete
MVSRFYGKQSVDFKWPRGWNVETMLPQERPFVLDEFDILEDALEQPVGTRTIDKVVNKKDKILIIVPDSNREFRYELVLNSVIRKISKINKDIVFMIVGTDMNELYIDDQYMKFLKGLEGVKKVMQYSSEDKFDSSGKTKAGTRIKTNKYLNAFTKIITIDQINFHDLVGYSGGPETLINTCSTETITKNRSLVFNKDKTRNPRCSAARLKGNRIYEDLIEISANLKPHFNINVLLDENKKIARVFCGDFSYCHMDGSKVVMGFYRALVPRRKVLIASAGGAPFDNTLSEALKGILFWYKTVSPRGALFYSAECSLGFGNKEMFKWAAYPAEVLRQKIIDDFSPAAYNVLRLKEAQRHCDIFINSSLPNDELEFLGFKPVSNFAEGLLKLRKHSEGLPELAWIPNACQVLGIPG